jgi:hypothetical protein
VVNCNPKNFGGQKEIHTCIVGQRDKKRIETSSIMGIYLVSDETPSDLVFAAPLITGANTSVLVLASFLKQWATSI